MKAWLLSLALLASTAGAAPDPELEPAAAQMIEHADLFVEARRIVGRQQIDERT